MSTLSEIAANHANAAKALQAQTAASREPCATVSEPCEPTFALPAVSTAEQMAPYTFVATGGSKSGQALSLSY